ncbi:MAG: 3-dehydroquinate synthase [Acidobacteriota bacterium]
MNSIRIDVTSERATYPVVIGPGLARALPGLLDAQGITRQRLVVSCAPVWRLHGRRLRPLLAKQDKPALIADGERAKTLATVASLYEQCVRRGLDRSAAVIAVGGGVVGDVGGFAAASYLRGIRLVQVPTTLLAQVDSAIGGKVGVNLSAGKNLVGAFHSPSLVACDPELLRTLPRREFRAGLYEVVKYGVIASSTLFDHVHKQLGPILNVDTNLLTPIVADCCRIKADVVMRDEREMGPRRALNFGHTIGHALEAITKYRRFRHGEAIGHGMLAAATLSVMRGAMSSSDADRLAAVIRDMGALPAVTDLRISDALDVIARDKKVVNGRLHFVLAAGIGSTVVVSDVHTRELTQAMRAIGMKK